MLIGTSHGALVEYSLQPVVASQVERIAQDVPVALNIHAQAQWSLNRYSIHYLLILMQVYNTHSPFLLLSL